MFLAPEIAFHDLWVLIHCCSIVWTQCSTISDVGLCEVPLLRRLSNVSIRGCSGLSEASLLGICKLRFLERLDVSDIYHLRSESLNYLSMATKLEQLVASNVEYFGNETLSLLCEKAPKLTHLDVSYSRRISQKGLQSLSLLSNLSTLDLSGITRVDSTSWLALAELTGLKSLSIRTALSSKVVSSEFAAIALPALHHLERLRLGYCHLSSKLCAQVQASTQLRSLEISNQHKFSADEFQAFSNLTQLKWTHSTLPVGAMKHLRGLEKLAVDFCTTEKAVVVTEEDGGEVHAKTKTSFNGIRKITSLRALSAKACELDDGMLRSICASSRLERLELLSMPKVNIKGIRQIRKLESLKKLDLSNFAMLDDKGVGCLAPYLDQLEELSLANCRGVTNASADTVSVFCPVLKHAIFFHTNITDDGVRSFARLRYLILLDVSGCQNVTSAAVWFLRTAAPRCHINAFHLSFHSDLESRGNQCVIS